MTKKKDDGKVGLRGIRVDKEIYDDLKASSLASGETQSDLIEKALMLQQNPIAPETVSSQTNQEILSDQTPVSEWVEPTLEEAKNALQAECNCLRRVPADFNRCHGNNAFTHIIRNGRPQCISGLPAVPGITFTKAQIEYWEAARKEAEK